MAFGTLNIGSLVYNSVGPGEYMLSTVGFGQPVDMIKLNPGKKANAKAPTSASITRILEKDVLDATLGYNVRKRLSITEQINQSEGFTTAEANSSIVLVSNLCTAAFLTRLLLGES